MKYVVVLAIVLAVLGVYAWAVMRHKPKSDAAVFEKRDMLVIAELVRAGTDMSKEHLLEFTLLFPSREAGDKAVELLKGLGCEIAQSELSEGSRWLVVATRSMNLRMDEIRPLREEIRRLTSELGGEYDGWGTEVLPIAKG